MKPDTWYTEAVDWASQTDIVSGTGAGFDPEGSVTREQVPPSCIPTRKLKGWDVSKTANLQDFCQTLQMIPPLGQPRAMEWAYAEKLDTGKGWKVFQTRRARPAALVATILMRLLESKAKNA